MPRLTPPLAALVLVLMLGLHPTAGLASPDFRQQNDLVDFAPPAWFLEGHFVAREVGPHYLFGSVADFVKSLNCPTAWLIEDAEAARQERLAKEGKNFEYTIYLEAAGPAGPVYWVFVVLPHKNAQEWFEERRSYHRSKAKAYYGQTQSGLERAMAEGLTVAGELRFLVEDGQVSLKVPEEVLMQGAKFPARYDLRDGKRL
ncbi:MAG: hypothetical protein HY910_12245 [Desulfarculus sp.]|nr:hypothetical protein [Desulfarculus sp.]